MSHAARHHRALDVANDRGIDFPWCNLLVQRFVQWMWEEFFIWSDPTFAARRGRRRCTPRERIRHLAKGQVLCKALSRQALRGATQ